MKGIGWGRVRLLTLRNGPFGGGNSPAGGFAGWHRASVGQGHEEARGNDAVHVMHLVLKYKNVVLWFVWVL